MLPRFCFKLVWLSKTIKCDQKIIKVSNKFSKYQIRISQKTFDSCLAHVLIKYVLNMFSFFICFDSFTQDKCKYVCWENILMQFFIFVALLIIIVAGFPAVMMPKLAMKSLFTHHFLVNIIIRVTARDWGLCKLHIIRLQVRWFRCKYYLFYGLPIFPDRCDKGRRILWPLSLLCIIVLWDISHVRQQKQFSSSRQPQFLPCRERRRIFR